MSQLKGTSRQSWTKICPQQQLVEANAYSDIVEEGSSSFNSSSHAVKLRMAARISNNLSGGPGSMDQPELSSEHAGTKSVASQTDDDTGTRDQQGMQFLRSLSTDHGDLYLFF